MADDRRRVQQMMNVFWLFACLFLIVGAHPGPSEHLGANTAHSIAHRTLVHRGVNATADNSTKSSNDTITAARQIIAEAMIQQGIYNKYRFDHPRRNSYKPGQRVPIHRRDEGEPEAPHLNATIIAAAALVAQHDAKAQAANGTLDKSYPPLSYKADDADASPPSTGSNEKRAVEDDWWVPAINRDGSAPMGGSGSFAV